MLDRPEMSLRVRRTTRGAVLVDAACGACASCAAGATLWCLAPVADGRDLGPSVAPQRVAAVADALLALAALDAAPAAPTVLVLGDPTGPAAVLARELCAARVVAVSEPAAARDELAGEPTGRAGVVVAGPNTRAAVRAVRRGGHVCVTGRPGATPPSVTELVQREVTLVSPRDVVPVAARINTDLWTAAAVAA